MNTKLQSRALIATATFGISLGISVLAQTLPPPSAAGTMIPPGTNRAKDFAAVKKDGLFHVFYIKHDNALPNAQTEKAFGHASSRNLYNWTQHPDVLHVSSGGSWENDHVWAPSIVKSGSTYYMFYTGVAPGPGNGIQSIGVATSTDLFAWSSRTLVLNCSTQATWSMCGDFRDPYVMPDPSHAGWWLMYYSTRPKQTSMPAGFPTDQNNDYIVGVARSTGNLLSWIDLGPPSTTNPGALLVTHKSVSFNSLLESAHLLQRPNGTWYTWVTTNAGKPLGLFTTTDPLAQQTTWCGSPWCWRGRLQDMLQQNIVSWYASEALYDDVHGARTDDYYAVVAGNNIEFRQIQWSTSTNPNESWKFSLIAPVNVTSINFNRTLAGEGQLTKLTINTSGSFAGRVANLEAWEVDDTGAWDPISPSQLGLPSQVTLTGPTTEVSFYPVGSGGTDDDSTPTQAEYRVRYLGETQTLTVDPPPTNGCYDPSGNFHSCGDTWPCGRFWCSCSNC